MTSDAVTCILMKRGDFDLFRLFGAIKKSDEIKWSLIKYQIDY